jgi:hypothetical protein
MRCGTVQPNREHANIVSRGLNSLGHLRVKSVCLVHSSGSLLEDTKRLDKWRRQALGRPTDVKVLERATGLSANMITRMC